MKKLNPLDIAKSSAAMKVFVGALGSSFLVASVGTSVLGHFVFQDRLAELMKAPGGRASGGERLPAMQVATLSDEAREKILGRNLFNSSGELGDADVDAEPVAEEATDEVIKSKLPLKLLGLIFGGIPSNGIALIEDTAKSKRNSYFIGDSVTDDASLVEVHEDRVIILRKSGQREFIPLEVKELVRSRRKAGDEKKTRRGGPNLADIANSQNYQEAGFERTGKKIVITEEFKRDMLGNQLTQILQDAKAEPNMVGGKLQGFRLTRIREGSIYEKAGFQNDDIVLEINDIPLRNVAGTIRLLQELRSESQVDVRVDRGGTTFNMEISVQ